LVDQREIWSRDEGSHADIGHVTKNAIFANSSRRTAAISKIALSPYLRRELSDFDEIWYTDTNFHSERENLPKKSKFFKCKMADGRHIENRFWLYLGAILADLCKFRNGDEELYADIGHLTKMAIFANSRWWTDAILKIVFGYISAPYWPINVKCGMEMTNHMQIEVT